MKTMVYVRSILGALALASMTAGVLVGTTAAYSSTAAQEQSQRFTIDNMTCASCPITVRIAMKKVEGVKAVKVDFKTKTADVTFDPALTNAAEIAKASTNAGYPAHAKTEAIE